MKCRIAGRVVGFVLGLGLPVAIGLSAPPYRVDPAASPVLTVQAGDQKEAEVKEVLDRCKHSGLSYANCDCMAAEYRVARAAAPSQYEALKTYDKTRTKCFDRKKLEEHYSKTVCGPHNQLSEMARKSKVNRPFADCPCVGRRIADLIMTGKYPGGQDTANALLSCRAS